jgi:hypothetical protein
MFLVYLRRSNCNRYSQKEGEEKCGEIDGNRRSEEAARMPVQVDAKWFLFFFCPSASNMGLFDGQILIVLRDGESRELRLMVGAKNGCVPQNRLKTPKKK